MAFCFMLFGFFGTIISTSVILRWKQQQEQQQHNIIKNNFIFNANYHQYSASNSPSPLPPLPQYNTTYYLQRNRLLQPQHLNTQVILDWDDTLFPTSWTLLNMQNGKTNRALINEQQWKQLQALNTAVIQLFLLLIQLFGASNVCIVTNAKMSWFESSCLMYKQKFLGVRDLIVNAYNIQVISAMDSHARQKASAFMDVLGCKPHINRVVSIGDSSDEYEAVHSVCSVLNVTAKRSMSYYRFKLLQNPSLCAMTKQLNAIKAMDFAMIASKQYDDSYHFK